MKEDMVLMSRERIERSVKRMACEIFEEHADGEQMILFGIDERGFAVARALAAELASFYSQPVQTARLPRGDTGKTIKKAEFKEHSVAFVVDDVIFSGRTMFHALTGVARNINPSEMHTVVLVDRGHRKFPVKAEFKGLELPTKLNEYVSVKMQGEHIIEVLLKK